MKGLLAAVGVAGFVLSLPTVAVAGDPKPPPAASAQAAPDEPEWKLKQRRQILFDDGQKLIAQGHPKEALEKFLEVYRLRRHPRVLLWMGLAQDQLSHLLSARRLYKQAAADSRVGKQEDIERDAAKALADLAPRIPHIALVFPSSANAAVLIDAVEVTLQDGRTEVDPGKHTLVVSAPGRKSYRTEFEVQASEEKSLSAALPLGSDGPPSEPPRGGCAGCATGGGGTSALSAGLVALLISLVRRRARGC